MLKSFKIDVLVDVRRFPKSSKYPHFNRESLCKKVASEGVLYFWLGDVLGGFREVGYKEYMRTDDFARGLDQLIVLINKAKDPAVMCSELLWFKCHRRLIADELALRGFEVMHIVDVGKCYRHKLRAKRG